MNNLEKSERVISLILTHLMEQGIQQSFVDFTELINDDELKPFVGPCFRWLEAEGIVASLNEASSDDGFAAIDPTLTSRGFALMGAKVEVEGEQTEVSQVVKQVAKEGRTFSNIGELLGSALGAFTKSIAS